MATKPESWHTDLRKLLVPRLLKALEEDRAGRIPLPAEQRRQVRKILCIVMTPAEIAQAIGRKADKAKLRRK